MLIDDAVGFVQRMITWADDAKVVYSSLTANVDDSSVLAKRLDDLYVRLAGHATEGRATLVKMQGYAGRFDELFEGIDNARAAGLIAGKSGAPKALIGQAETARGSLVHPILDLLHGNVPGATLEVLETGVRRAFTWH